MMSKYLRLFVLIMTFIVMLAAGSTVLATTDLATTFTYQGFLSNNGAPILVDNCDFKFGLFDTPTVATGIQLGVTQTVSLVPVSGGVFTVALNGAGEFGASAFNGNDHYLDIQVSCPSVGGGFIQLTPRSPVTSAPSALFAANAALAVNATNATLANGLPALTIQTNATSPNLIGGFSGNTVVGGVVGATIGGGGVSGEINQINGSYGTISGGVSNTTSGLGSTVGGGEGNNATTDFATIAGGRVNLASNQFSSIGGGSNNQALGFYSTVAGGGPTDPVNNPTTTNNVATDDYTTVGGGGSNQAGDGAAATTNAPYGTVSGGNNNTASGLASTIPGGENNVASGSYSFAGGRRAKANAAGAFVWADSTDADMVNSTINSFVVRATGGFAFYTDATATEGATMPPGGGGWSILSDRNVKNNFESVDPRIILDDLASMPISTWNYNAQDASIRHIGPMAQDFYTAFGVGEDNRHISTVDSSGVALAAIQGLYQVVQDKDAQIATLQTENAELKTRLDDLDQRLSALEALAAPSQAGVGLPVMLMGVVLLGGLGFAGRRVLRKDTSL